MAAPAGAGCLTSRGSSQRPGRDRPRLLPDRVGTGSLTRSPSAARLGSLTLIFRRLLQSRRRRFHLELPVGVGIVNAANHHGFSGARQGTAVDVELANDWLRAVLFIWSREIAEIAMDVQCKLVALVLQQAIDRC